MTEKKTLTKIFEDHKSLQELLIERGGEITDAEEEAILDFWAAEFLSNLANKIDAYAFRFKSLDAADEYLDRDLKSLRAAIRVVGRFKDGLKDRLKSHLIQNDITRVVGEKHIVALCAAKPSVEIFDEDLIPATFCREKITIEPDKEKILEMLKSGGEVPGARLKESVSLRMTTNNKMQVLGVERLVQNATT